ncbi:MAG TPA: hypothetical protein VKU19_15690 [Bryobacteraceae bacterium]|nr:hypothetical protein [Bryobacteraceae bacterium]
MGKFLLAAALLASAICAQTPAVSLNELEKEFQESMAGVTLQGQSTRDGAPGLSEDKYKIEKVQKTGDDQWTIFAQVEMRGQTMTVPLPLQVKWAGDTPVITLTDQALPGMGTYTARVVVYRGQYAGTWSGKTGGGKVFGRVVKN